MDDTIRKKLQEQMMYSLINKVFQKIDLSIEQKKEQVLNLGRKLGKKSYLLLNKYSLLEGKPDEKDNLKSIIEDLWPYLFGTPNERFFPSKDTASFREDNFKFIKRVDSNYHDPDEQKEYCLLLLVFIEGIIQGALQSLMIEFKLEVIYNNECLFVHIDIANDNF